MDIHVTLHERRDLAAEIYRQLRVAIIEGRLRGGQSLPSTREMALRLGVSRTSVSVAYDRLLGEGFVQTKVGAGTFVAPHVAAHVEKMSAPPSALQPHRAWSDAQVPREMWRPAKFDFRSGLPDVKRFPYEAWRRLLVREFRPSAKRAVYGPAAGLTSLREAIARHIAVSRGVAASPENIVITSGTQQAVDLIARVLVRPNDRVAIEEPGYGPPRRLLAAMGLHVSGVPVDSEGLRVDAIPANTRIVYVSPSHQYPLGMVMSLRRRLALLEWARDNDAAIIEDDYDSEFRFDGRPLEPLHTLDTHGRVIYVGSFSKTMLPALRLGFVLAPRAVTEAINGAKHLTDWHSPFATQAAMAKFIEMGSFARHVRRMRSIYQARHRVLNQLLQQHLSDELEIVPSAAGLHIAAYASRATNDRITEVVKRAANAGVECTSLAMYPASESKLAGLVLGYGAIDKENIAAGVRALQAAFADERG